MGAILPIIIQLVSGAAGGNIVGRLSGALNGGSGLNTILGALGGLGGASVLGGLLGGDAAAAVDATASSGLDLPAILAMVGGGAVGGGALGGIGGLIRNMLAK